MMPSIINRNNNKNSKIKLWSVVFWLLVWQLGSMVLGQEILLVSPVSVFIRLSQLVREERFWFSLAFSLLRITLGFFLAAFIGVFLAMASYGSVFVKELLKPVMIAIKSVPVVSFIILVLIWVSSKNLSVVISFLMVLPIMYTNVLAGIDHRDEKLKEMSQVFQIPLGKRIRYVDIPQVIPYFVSASHIGLGLSWKSGIAAEVIGVAKGSIGEQLYLSKIYLDTTDLLAWTVLIVLMSLIFEKVFLLLVSQTALSLERMKR